MHFRGGSKRPSSERLERARNHNAWENEMSLRIRRLLKKSPFLNASLALGELECLAGALEAVLLAFLHAAIAGQVTRIAQLLGHAVRGILGADLGAGGQCVHALEGASDSLADGPALSCEAATRDAHLHVELAAHLEQIKRTDDGVAILVFGEIVGHRLAIDLQNAIAFADAHAGDSRLPSAGTQVELLFRLCFRHVFAPGQAWTLNSCGC